MIGGLCPVPKCGRVFGDCDHTVIERCQTSEEFAEDEHREMTDNELKGYNNYDQESMIAAAQEVADQRREGIFKPTFPN